MIKQRYSQILIKNAFLLLLISRLFVSCSCSEDKKQIDYANTIDNLSMIYTPIDSLSNYTGVSVNTLVAIRLGVANQNNELNTTLDNLNVKFNDDFEAGMDELKDGNSPIDYSPKYSFKQYNKEKMKQFESHQNERFQNALDSVTIDYFSTKAEECSSSYFGILRIPVVIWNWITKSNSEVVNVFKEKNKNALALKDYNMRINDCIRYYSYYVNAERNFCGIKSLVQSPPKITLTNDDIAMSQKAQDSVIEDSFISTLDYVGSSILEWMSIFFVCWILEKFCSVAIARAMGIHESIAVICFAFSKKHPRTSGLISFINNIVAEYRQQEIIDRFKNYKKIAKIILSVIFIVLPLVIFTRLEIQLEQTITKETMSSYGNYLSRQNTYVLNYFNNETEKAYEKN